MKRFLLSVLLLVISISTIPQANAMYPGDLEKSYPVWRYNFSRSMFDTPGWVMNSYEPQGIFQKKPLFLRIR